jgi:hypothetical protein
MHDVFIESNRIYPGLNLDTSTIFKKLNKVRPLFGGYSVVGPGQYPDIIVKNVYDIVPRALEAPFCPSKERFKQTGRLI